MKTACITDTIDAFPIKKMKYSLSPVMQILISPKVATDLPKLVEGFKKVSKSDSLA